MSNKRKRDHQANPASESFAAGGAMPEYTDIPRWEYCAAKFPYNEVAGAVMGFTTMGKKGWELISVMPGAGTHVAIFKRQVPGSVRIGRVEPVSDEELREAAKTATEEQS